VPPHRRRNRRALPKWAQELMRDLERQIEEAKGRSSAVEAVNLVLKGKSWQYLSRPEPGKDGKRRILISGPQDKELRPNRAGVRRYTDMPRDVALRRWLASPPMIVALLLVACGSVTNTPAQDEAWRRWEACRSQVPGHGHPERAARRADQFLGRWSLPGAVHA
jgi:hypothetical protein